MEKRGPALHERPEVVGVEGVERHAGPLGLLREPGLHLQPVLALVVVLVPEDHQAVGDLGS